MVARGNPARTNRAVRNDARAGLSMVEEEDGVEDVLGPGVPIVGIVRPREGKVERSVLRHPKPLPPTCIGKSTAHVLRV